MYTGRVYGDGSGTRSNLPQIRRVGWSAVMFDQSSLVRARCGACLAQTVGAAEHTSCFEAVAHGQSSMVFVTDHLNLCKSYTRGKRYATHPTRPFADIVRRLFNALEEWGDFSIDKFAAHLAYTDALCSTISEADWRGNRAADEYAKKAVALHNLPDNLVISCHLAHKVVHQLLVLSAHITHRLAKDRCHIEHDYESQRGRSCTLVVQVQP